VIERNFLRAMLGDDLSAITELEWKRYELERKIWKRNPQEEDVAALQRFWRGLSQVSNSPKTVCSVARAYFSVPVASSKSESTFSYTGEVITKRRNQIGVHLAEASTVVYDYIRQPDYDLKQLMAGVNQLSAEYEEVKAEAEEARNRRRQELEAELEALDNI
jgi:hAT family C-terminal dimerisation region